MRGYAGAARRAYRPAAAGVASQTTRSLPGLPSAKFGELAYRPGAGRGGDVMSQHGKTRLPMSWRRGGESAGLATARLQPGAGRTSIGPLHAVREGEAMAQGRGDTPCLEARSGSAAYLNRAATQENPLTTIQRHAHQPSPTYLLLVDGLPPPPPTPTTGRPCRIPSRLGRCVGDRREHDLTGQYSSTESTNAGDRCPGAEPRSENTQTHGHCRRGSSQRCGRLDWDSKEKHYPM
jgi:hypothetical protein